MRPQQMLVHVAAAGLVATALTVSGSPSAASSAAYPSGVVVSMTGGIVRGLVDGAEKQWRGVPYAAPPIGDLRFRPAVPMKRWNGVRDATTFAPECLQPGSEGVAGSEDCLYLNIFAPASSTASSHLAVMVHLHPGSNTYGDAYQDASAFTARNVIVVSVGYRLGVLGWVGHPALSAEGGGSSGEYGVLDQLAALRWVHAYIARFGGDPSRVTLFGSSAGSFDTVALMASPLARGLMTRAAVQGEYLTFFNGTHNTMADAEELGVEIAQAAGCGSDPDVAGCLRALPAADLVDAGGSALDLGPWTGGKVLPRSPLRLLEHPGDTALLVGIDREENAFWMIDDSGNLPTSYSHRQWVQDTNDLVGTKYADRALALYPPSAYDSLLWSWITMATDLSRGCPVQKMATEVAAHAPVWRYLYTHTMESDPYFAQFRASHILEEPFLWDGDLLGIGYEFSQAEQVLSQRMTDYWTNFAKNGNPNGPRLQRWPAYDSSRRQALLLDDQVSVVPNYHLRQCVLLDNVKEPFPAPPEAPSGFRSAQPSSLHGRLADFS
jgi:para-nitrobenzyl esterase